MTENVGCACVRWHADRMSGTLVRRCARQLLRHSRCNNRPRFASVAEVVPDFAGVVPDLAAIAQPLAFESGAAASACEAPAAATGGGGESPAFLWGEEVDLGTFEAAYAETEKAFLLEAAQLEQTQQALLTRHESDATRDFDAAVRDLETLLSGVAPGRLRPL